MGSILDYFRCEALDLNFRLLVVGGFWPLETKIKWQQILFSVFSYLCFFSVTSMLAIQFLDLYLLRNDLLNLTKDLCAICISWAIVVKSHLLLYNIKPVNELRGKLTEYKKSLTDPDDVDIIQASDRQTIFITKTFYAITVSCCVFWLLYPGLEAGNQHGIPFPYRLPVEELTETVYVCLYVYQAMSMIGFMFSVLSVDGIFCGFILRINAHYDIVIKNLKALGDTSNPTFVIQNGVVEVQKDVENNKTKSILKILRKNIKLHKKILNEIQVLEKVFSAPCLVHFIAVTTLTSAVVIDLIRVSKGFRLQILQRLLYLTIALWDTFLYSYFATLLQQKSLEMSEAVYSAEWYTMTPAVRKQLLIVNLKAQKVPKIKMGKIFPINMSTFLTLLRTSYDLTALLYQTTRK